MEGNLAPRINLKKETSSLLSKKSLKSCKITPRRKGKAQSCNLKGQPQITTFQELKKSPAKIIGLGSGIIANERGKLSLSSSKPSVITNENLLGEKTIEASNLTGEKTTQLQERI